MTTVADSPQKTLFDHVKHIRNKQDPEYYTNLSEHDRKTFHPFMLLRALSMDESILGKISELYKYIDCIPHDKFYLLLIKTVPKSGKFIPWVKGKALTYNPELTSIICKHYNTSRRQSNEYITLLLRSTPGQEELIKICKSYGLSDEDLEKIIT